VTFPAIESLPSGRQTETRSVPTLDISSSSGLVVSWVDSDNSYQLQSMELLGNTSGWQP
jgi:hypothetical protein